MEIAPQGQIKLKLNVLPGKTKKAFDYLSRQSWVGRSDWYLAGGTALALQSGHRQSVDLDFFTQQKSFSNVALLNHFTGNPDWRTVINKEHTVYGELFGAKISFIAYPFFIPKQELARYGAIKILQPRDIAVMKIVAISQRGRKRDFFDLYWCANNIEPLEQSVRRLKAQYPAVAHEYNHILKSLVYFVDAESDPMPKGNRTISWEEVKKFFKKQVPEIAGSIIGIE